MLSDEQHPDEFYYERFVGPDSLAENIRFLTKKKDVRYLYIATHGNENSLRCPNGSSVRRNTFSDIIYEANRGTRLDGVFLGACLFGNDKTATTLLTNEISAPQRIKWVVGYGEEVDWLESSLIDVYMLSNILHLSNQGATPSTIIRKVANDVHVHMDGLARKLKLRIHVRKKKTGGIMDLMQAIRDKRENEADI